jgi:hypothetical protein
MNMNKYINMNTHIQGNYDFIIPVQGCSISIGRSSVEIILTYVVEERVSIILTPSKYRVLASNLMNLVSVPISHNVWEIT